MSKEHKEICKVFASGSYCKFGKRCRYLHFRPPKITKSTLVSENIQHEAVNSSRSSAKVSNTSSFSVQTNSALKHEELNKFKLNSEGLQKLQGESDSNNGASENNQKDGYKYKSSDVEHSKQLKNICHFFQRHKRCQYGNRCRYSHILPSPIHLDTSVSHGADKVGNHEIGEANIDSASKPLTVNEVCRFYRKGFCRQGSRCKWSHNVSKLKDELHSEAKASTGVKSGSDMNPRLQQNVYLSSSVAEKKEQENVREIEITAFKKRFPKCAPSLEDVQNAYEFCFNPTDPDWPYDVKSLEMKVTFPELYPIDCMKITLLQNEIIPNTVKRYIRKSIDDWVEERFSKLKLESKVELMFRPFLKWLDRSIEDLFTAGLKLYQKELIALSSGIELVPASELKEKFEQTSIDSDVSVGDEDSGTDELDENDDSDDLDESCESGSDSENHDMIGAKLSIDPVKRGTEVKLHNLLLKENTATLAVRKVHLILQCSRCKNKEELITPVDRVNSTQCSKCLTEQLINFRASLAHKFTNIVGYVDAQGCSVFDMILAECDFLAGCLKCSNDCHFGNLPPGQPKDTWCHHCHAKVTVAADCAKFLQLQPADIQDVKNVHNVGLRKARKPPKDPAIQEGKPLPDNGACKHYKKSFRWLRFPCCGKAYPCDVCHDDKEDHEMKFASRMICGYCAKEQPYAGDRPCKSCNAFLVKKFTEHWEGGKGCRDIIRMSCGDKKKYTNQHKTVSRKSQAKQTKNSKKNTKIRHA